MVRNTLAYPCNRVPSSSHPVISSSSSRLHHYASKLQTSRRLPSPFVSALSQYSSVTSSLLH